MRVPGPPRHSGGPHEAPAHVTPHVHALRIPFEIRPAPHVTLRRFVYVYVVLGTRRVVLIDTGVAGSHEAIFQVLRDLGRQPRDIAAIVLTHSHPDHIGSAKVIQEASGCRVVAHQAERPWIEDVALQASQRPVPGFETLVAGPVRVDRVVQDGDRLDLDEDLSVTVLHTPGHSAGSISLHLHLDRVLFTGDAVAVAAGFPVYDDVMDSVRSILRLREVPDVDVLLSSWDEPRRGPDVGRVLEEGLATMQRVHDQVRQIACPRPDVDPAVLCRQVVDRLGLPGLAASPMTARSLQAHLKVLDVADLLA
ncbi:MAG: MBL fold metallo-hydrolase [Phycisphaerae bacterium]|nr:MBL fold metallo-hydrolase [Phycisphaerae bacterium]